MQNTAPLQSQKPQEDGRSPLPDEPNLWYRRYCLYRDLGHKRSLRAVVAKERESLRVVQTPPQATKGQTKKQRAKNAHGQEVKPVLNVPGSWKEASKHY